MSRPSLLVAALGIAFLLASCTHDPPRATPAQHPCAALDEANRALLVLPASSDAGGAGVEFYQGLRAATVCKETAHGVWAIELSMLEIGAGQMSARWSLVHINSSGARVSVTPEVTSTLGPSPVKARPSDPNILWTEARRVLPTAPVLFDYDGDGEFEAIVVVETTEVHESGWSFHTRQGRVWTVRGDAVELYPPARAVTVEEARDVDGDHRPDLLTHGPYAELTTIKCGSDESYPVYGPLLLGHALANGTFSFSDSQAISFAKRECASPPSKFLVAERARPEIVDFGVSARSIACARLWDVPASRMNAEIATRCLARDPCPTCDDSELLSRWVSLPPPLRLSEGH